MKPSDTHDINKAYISPYDCFLNKFDRTHKLSAAQIKEIAKHQRIAALRDNPLPDAAEKIVWEKF